MPTATYTTPTETVALDLVREAALTWLAFDATHTIDQLAAAAGLSARDLQQLLSIAAADAGPAPAPTFDEDLARRLTDHMETTTRARLAAAR